MNHSFGILFSLLSAMVYGGADFFGGFASKRSHSFQVLIYASLISIVTLLILALSFQEGMPLLGDIFFASIAGVLGGGGLIFLYMGISQGKTSIVSSVSGVLSASLPAILSTFIEGFPGYIKLIGFIVGIIGIWFVCQTRKSGEDKHKISYFFILGVFAGIGFAGFFISLSYVTSNAVFIPLCFGKLTAILTGILGLLFIRKPIRIPWSNKACILSGSLDALANAFFLIGRHNTRLDTSVVLVSLYPIFTIFMSKIVQKEVIILKQWVGVVLSLAAIVLIIY